MANKNDEPKEDDFPGYPHYPAKEDIMNSKDNERIALDVESLAQSKKLHQAQNLHGKTSPADAGPEPGTDDEAEKQPANEADITDEDLIALGDQDVVSGTTDTLSGDDLDVPGAEDDDENEEIGEEDEENNYYSLGGDAHDNLEEDKD